MESIAGLAEEFFNSDDGNRCAALATQIVAWFVERRDGQGLARTVERLDRAPFIRALHEAASAGAGVPAVASALLEVFGSKEVAEALTLFLAHDPSRLAEVLEAAPGSLLEPVLEKAVELRLDVGPGLARLQSLPYRLRGWAERGIDMSPVAAKLEKGLGLERSTAVLSSSVLAFSALHRRDLGQLDRLLSHPSENVRWGAVRALSEFLLADPKSGPLVDRLALALADEAGDVRKQALLGLETVRKAGHALQPSPDGLERIAATLGRHPETMQAVYGWVVRSKELATTVRDLLAPRGAHPRLLTICQAVIAGTHPAPCPICSLIDDFECAGYEEDLPRATKLLEPAGAEERRCPQCGTRYHWAWSELYNDEFGSTGTYDVRRLDPLPGAKSLAETPPVEKLRERAEDPDDFVHDSARRMLPRVGKAMGPQVEDLASLDDKIRQDSSNRFADAALIGQDISSAAVALAKLLDDPAYETRRNALQSLQWAGDEFDLTACLPVLNGLLKQGRQCDAVLEVLQVMQVKGGQSILPAVEGVIAAITVTFRAAAVLEVLYDKGADLSAAQAQILKSLEAPRLEPFHDRLVRLLAKVNPTSVELLLKHPRERVRKVARACVSR